MKSSYLAHGKVILMGEHAVVYGYHALAMPIKSLQIKATVEPASQMWMKTARYDGPFWTAPAEYAGLKYVLKTMLAKLTQPATVKITYQSTIPIERGLGSSATVALATTRALNEYFALQLSEAEIMAITNHAETIIHGKASGIDAATVNSEHLIFFDPQTGPRELAARLGASLLIMDTGELGNTKKAVTQVRQLIEASPVAAKQLKNLGQLPDQTKQAWLEQDLIRVGKLFNQAQAILQSFNLATARIDQLQQLALTTGALGFKLSGSGLGGIVIALCANRETAAKIAAKCQPLIANSWIEEI